MTAARKPRMISRRDLLKGLSLGALAYALPTGLSGRAMAEPVTIPKRIIFFYGIGTMYDIWRPGGANGAPTPTETAFELGELHAPLAPHKADMLYVDGLGMVSEEIDAGEKGNAHQQGAKHALAPYNSAGPDLPGGTSIDQLIAQKLNEPQPVTAFPSLELQCATWTNDLQLYSNAVASGPGQALPGTWDPRKTYTRLFGEFMPPDQAAAEALRKRRQSIFALTKGEFPGLSSRLDKTDRQRLDTHLDLLSDLEKRLDIVGLTCQQPNPADYFDAIQGCDLSCYNAGTLQDARNFNLTTDLNSRLATAALACDLTRVVFMELGYAGDLDYGYEAGMFGTTDAHDLVHKVCDPNNPLANDPAARAVIKNQCIIEAQKLANLIQMLKDVPEGTGTLFDSTIILYCGQIGYGSHDLAQLPWVVIGSGQGHFKTGRYLKLGPNPKSTRGQPHNDLFVSLANAMGIDIQTFGNPNCCNGPLAGLTG